MSNQPIMTIEQAKTLRDARDILDTIRKHTRLSMFAEQGHGMVVVYVADGLHDLIVQLQDDEMIPTEEKAMK